MKLVALIVGIDADLHKQGSALTSLDRICCIVPVRTPISGLKHMSVVELGEVHSTLVYMYPLGREISQAQ